jgi:hypothetical protein
LPACFAALQSVRPFWPNIAYNILYFLAFKQHIF